MMGRQPATGRVWLMIATLYVTQGVPMGLAFMALPAILRAQNHSTDAIGLVGLVLLPWVLKFLWAPVIDRSGDGWLGRRRSWIVPAQVIVASLYGVIAVIGGADLPVTAIVLLLLAANTVGATQDVATDGWTVELLRGPQLASANGLQIGGFALGMVIGGAVTVVVFEHGGWALAFTVLAVLTLASIIPVLLVPDSTRQRAAPAASLRVMIRRPGAWLMISVAALFHFPSSMVGAMLGPFLIDKGLSLVDVGVITGTGVACIAIIGAAAGGLASRSFGARGTAVAAGLLGVFSLSLWAVADVASGMSMGMAIAITCTTGLAGGIAYVAFYTIFMQWASLDQAGTDFTVLQCTESLTNMMAAMLAGVLASGIGYAGLFVTATGVGVLAMAWIAFGLLRSARAVPVNQAIATEESHA